VWLLQGNKLVQKRILIGLNDETHVEVLKGLTANDMVVTGTNSGLAGVAVSTSPGGSPFLPHRPQRKGGAR